MSGNKNILNIKLPILYINDSYAYIIPYKFFKKIFFILGKSIGKDNNIIKIISRRRINKRQKRNIQVLAICSIGSKADGVFLFA